jgi:hypothetical protein
MKNVFYTAILMLFIANSAAAQISKGKVFLGGTVGFGQQTSEMTNMSSNYPTKQTYLTISPSVGKVIRENIILGVQASIATQRSDYKVQEFDARYKGYSGGVFMRRYVPLLKSFYFFGQGAADFSVQNSSEKFQGQTRNKAKGWGTSVSLYPGLAYAVTRKFYVEAALNNLLVAGYNRSETESKDPGSGVVSSSETSSFGFSTSLGSSAGFTIGFRFLL